MSFTVVSRIFADTPTWVFALFAYLVWQGVQRLRPTVGSLRRTVVVPLIFIAWGLIGLSSRPVDPTLVAIAWGGGALVGAALGLLGRPRGLIVDRAHGLVRQRGSLLPLLRYSLVFGSHYALAVAMAMHPAERNTLLLADITVSGIAAGYFARWLLAFAIALRTASEADLSATAAPTTVSAEAA